jgi:hypothetical protein
VVKAPSKRPPQPKPAGAIALWISVYDKHLHIRDGQACAKIYGSRGFTDPAFLIRDSDDFCHSLNDSTVKGVLIFRLRGCQNMVFHVKHHVSYLPIVPRGTVRKADIICGQILYSTSELASLKEVFLVHSGISGRTSEEKRKGHAE